MERLLPTKLARGASSRLAENCLTKWFFEKSGFSRKVVFREMWLFADTACPNIARRLTFRKKQLFDKNGFSGTVRESGFSKTHAARKITLLKKLFFKKSGVSGICHRPRCFLEDVFSRTYLLLKTLRAPTP